MKRSILFTLITTILQITVQTTAQAQTPRTLPYNYSFDSLVKVNESYLKEDERKLKLLNALALGYTSADPAKGIETGERAIVLAQKLKNQLLLAQAYNNKGANHSAKSEYPTALELYEKALVINQIMKNTYGIATNTLNIGDIDRLKGDFKKAKETYEQALTLFEGIADKQGIANCYNGIGISYKNLSDHTRALEYYQKALAIHEQMGNKSATALILGNIGNVYMSVSDHQKALEYHQKALTLNMKLGNKKGITINLGNLGIVYHALSDYLKALEYFQKSLAINELMGNKSGMATILNNIGGVYVKLSDYPKALEYQQKALAINEQVGTKKGIALNLGNIGMIYSSLSNYPKALEYLQKAFAIDEQLGNKSGMARHLGTIGSIFTDLSDYPSSLENHQKALAISEQIGAKDLLAYNLVQIGVIYRDAPDSVLLKMAISPAQRYEKALEYQNRGLIISKEIGELSREKSIWGTLSETYEKQGNFVKAHDAYKNYILLRDSIQSSEIKDKVERKTMQYEFDKKETEFKFQQQLTEEKLLRSTQEAILSRQQLLLSNKEKDLQRLEYLKEKAEKQQNENLLLLSDKERRLQSAALLSMAKEKDLQKTALQLSQAEVHRKSQERNAFIVGMILFLVLSFFIYRNYVGQRKSNKLIEAGNLELKETQSQLVQQEKLASLGALTAGIAHEIKNPLNFVNNFAELSNELIDEMDAATTEEEKSELLQTIKQNLTKINEHGKRADSIVKSMLEHSRSGTGEKQLTDINRVCEEFLNLAYHGMRANIKDFNCTIEKHLDAGLPKLNVVQQDISRVILNLINNAFYAIKDTPDATVTLSTKSLANAILISVKDNGTGMPQSVKQKIFEPFFTTKPSGSGTGLGLSLSFDIIKAHGGKIEVNSEEGKGTEFLITLPV